MEKPPHSRFRRIGGDTVRLREGQDVELKYPEGAIRNPFNTKIKGLLGRAWETLKKF